MKIKSLLVCGSMAVLGAAFTSCSKDIAFDSEGAAQQLNAEYEANFVKKYGAIDPNQTWDFATMQPIYRVSSSASSARSMTRSNESGSLTSTSGTIQIEGTITAWMHANLKAGVNNYTKGKPFYLKTVSSPFTIVPVFQGTASYYWELWMHANGYGDVKVWSKGDLLSYQKVKNGDWFSPGTGKAGIPKDAYMTSAPTITFADLPVDTELDFYLKVWDSESKFKSTNPVYQPRILSSLNEQMISLEGLKEKPTNVPAGNSVVFIGCEDNEDGDYDYEDLVFMMYGKPTPPIIPSDDTDVVYTKRYMMEDLGDTDDFDFNDVVVDVSETYRQHIHLKWNIINGSWEVDYKDDPVLVGQEAIVRAAGGIYDFTLTIGETSWTKSKDLTATTMYNTGWGNTTIDPNRVLARFPVVGWDRLNNNITLTVPLKFGENFTDKTLSIGFPKAGEAPKILAIDPSEPWMVERQGIPGGPNGWYTE